MASGGGSGGGGGWWWYVVKVWLLDRKQSAKLMNIHDTFEAEQPVKLTSL